jgi:regulation of enolase protein 1 (concanavalin A-like superfamily)
VDLLERAEQHTAGFSQARRPLKKELKNKRHLKTAAAIFSFQCIAFLACATIPTSYPVGPGPMNVIVGADGKLIYQPDTNGDTIPDISMCGYEGGGVPIPTKIPVVLTLNPVVGDNLGQIQNAIATVGNMPVQSNGFRGAILLKAGIYNVSDSILINKSGIILRGEGDGPDGTVLQMTGGNITILTMDNGGSGASEVANTRHNITDPYVPVGAKWFHVDSTNGWAVGDNIKVVRVCTANWLAIINQTNWSPGAFYVQWDRVITEMSSNRIAMDMPITQGIDTNYGGGYAFKYTYPTRLTNCAFEDIRGVCTNNVNTNGVTDGNFITLHNVMNCWVRRCMNYQMSGHTSETDGNSKWITFEDMVSYHTYVPSHSGSSIQINRYEGATGILYHRVTTSDGGFEFSSSGLTPGPNAIVECDVPHGFASTGPHMKWAVATFYDALYMNQSISVQDAGLNSSHGWTGANQIAWNVETTGSFNFDRPQTCHQMIIGGIGGFGANRTGTLPAETISKNTHVLPQCLYRQQLAERLGSPSVLAALGAPYGDNFYVLTARTNAATVSAGKSVSNSVLMTIVAPMPYTNALALASAPNMFTNYQGSAVSFSVSGLPPGATATFNPPSLNTNGATTLTITTTTSTPGGNYPLVIKGRGSFKAITGATFFLTNFDTMTLNIASVANFFVAANPDSQSIVAGAATNFSATVTPLNNFFGDVTLSVGGLPANASANFNPAVIIGASGTSTLTVTTSNNTPANVYALTIIGTDTNGNTAAAPVSLSVAPAPGTLPPPWADLDLGATTNPGEGTFSNNVFIVQGSGANIGGTSDQGHFVYQPFSGNVIFSARIASQQNTSGSDESGLMIREATSGDSSFASVVVTPANGVLMKFRTSSSATVAEVVGPNFTAPCWLKLIRSQNLFAGFASADGTNWIQIASTNIFMADPVSVGMTVCSHDPEQLSTSLFDNVTLVAPDFFLAATPLAQTVNAGLGASFSISIIPTNGFADVVALSESDDLTADASATLSTNSVTGSGAITLNANTATTTPQDNYTLTVTATSGGATHNISVALNVTSLLPAGLWTGASGEDLTWSDGQNWGNGLPPGASDNVKFFDLGGAASPATINNIVDSDTTIASLQFGNTNGFHNTLIAPNATLTITGNNGANGCAFFVGTASDNGSTQIVSAAISSIGAAFVISNSSANVNFGQGAATPISQRATADLSGADIFSAVLNNFYIGNQPANNSANPGRQTATVILAKTNSISLAPAGIFLMSQAASDGTTTGNILYLGQTNAIFANTNITSGGKGGIGNRVQFNPALIGQSPVATFRGAGGGTNRILLWAIGYASSSSANNDSIGTNDFTGGTVDALVDLMLVGRGQAANNGARRGEGTLTFDGGTIDVNTLDIGFQVSGNSSFAIGAVNVNGSAKLIANNVIALGFTGTNPGASTRASLNINGGSVFANSITNGGSGNSSVTLNNAALFVTNNAGLLTSAIPNFAMTNSVLHFRVDANFVATNIIATNFTAGGVNTIAIDSARNVTSQIVFPLISYASLIGSVSNHFALLLPPGFAGNLVDNSEQKRIDLNIAPLTSPHFDSVAINGGKISFAVTSGAAGGIFYLLTSTNISLPLTQWMRAATNQFDSDGNSSFTNSVNITTAQQFYILQLQ